MTPLNCMLRTARQLSQEEDILSLHENAEKSDAGTNTTCYKVCGLEGFEKSHVN